MYKKQLLLLSIMLLAMNPTFAEEKEEVSINYTVFHQVIDMLHMMESFDDTALCTIDTAEIDTIYTDKKWKYKFDLVLQMTKLILCT